MWRQLRRDGQESPTDLSTDFVDRLESRRQGIALAIEVNVISKVFRLEVAVAGWLVRREAESPPQAGYGLGMAPNFTILKLAVRSDMQS